MEPASYKFLMESIVDPVQKKCMLAAIRKYNTRCEKAYKELIDDLKKCQLKKKL
jgi:ribonucleotide reductase beta subunit family protein with ferritin-like domain